MKEKIVRKGDIFYADLSQVIGSEQGGIRPVVILQNDIGNRFSQTTIVAIITSKLTKAKMPTHICIDAEQYGLNKKSIILVEQIRTIDKRRIKEKLGKLNQEDIKKIDKAILVSFGIKIGGFFSLINNWIKFIANKNMSLIRKWALIDMGKKLSLKEKRFSINCRPDAHISKIMEI